MTGISLGSEFSDVLEGSGSSAKITVGTSAVAARVGGSNLVNRELLVIHNRGTQTIYRGYTSGVTTATGIPIEPRTVVAIPVGQAITVWLISGASEPSVFIEELT